MFEVLIPAPADPAAELQTLYRNSQNRVVMEYALGGTKDYRVYFTDGHPLFSLDETQVFAIANTPGLLGSFARDHRLAQIPFIAFEWKIPGIFEMTSRDLGRPLCQWPYAGFFTITQGSQPARNVLFVRRLDHPETHTYQVWCENGPGKVKLTTRFKNLGPIFYDDGGDGPLLAFSRPATVFLWNPEGTAIGPHLGPRIIVVPGEVEEHFLTMAAEGYISPQDAVNSFEARVDAVDKSAPSEK